jgi:hypothetical protein
MLETHTFMILSEYYQNVGNGGQIDDQTTFLCALRHRRPQGIRAQRERADLQARETPSAFVSVHTKTAVPGSTAAGAAVVYKSRLSHHKSRLFFSNK